MHIKNPCNIIFIHFTQFFLFLHFIRVVTQAQCVAFVQNECTHPSSLAHWEFFVLYSILYFTQKAHYKNRQVVISILCYNKTNLYTLYKSMFNPTLICVHICNSSLSFRSYSSKSYIFYLLTCLYFISIPASSHYAFYHFHRVVCL